MKIEHLYRLFTSHPAIVIDSRIAREGAIFFALQGEHVDGNAFAAQALERGCAYAVVGDPAVVRDDRYILVEDPLETLQKLAAYHRRQLDIPVIALTGTNGKTTTKELILQVLSRKYRVSGTQGNLNNHIGLPLTILSAAADTEILVTEMGANHPGEIAFLCRIARPTHGLITNIGKAHLEGFGSLEAIIRTKTELYDHIRKKEGVVFYNFDDELLRSHAGRIRDRISYGMSEEADIVFKGPLESEELQFVWESPAGGRIVKTRMYGKYNLGNAMAAIAVGVGFGVPPDEIVSAVTAYVPGNMRSQVIKTERGNTVIMDAYNANPSSMQYAVEAFSTLRGKKKAVILGDMYELGTFAEEEHTRILNLLRENGFVSDVLLVGEHFPKIAKDFGYRAFAEKDRLRAYLKEKKFSGYVILVKGSRMMKLEELLTEL